MSAIGQVVPRERPQFVTRVPYGTAPAAATGAAEVAGTAGPPVPHPATTTGGGVISVAIPCHGALSGLPRRWGAGFGLQEDATTVFL